MGRPKQYIVILHDNRLYWFWLQVVCRLWSWQTLCLRSSWSSAE